MYFIYLYIHCAQKLSRYKGVKVQDIKSLKLNYKTWRKFNNVKERKRNERVNIPAEIITRIIRDYCEQLHTNEPKKSKQIPKKSTIHL